MILNIITSKGHLNEKWFDFGYELGLTVGQLDDIEMRYHDPLQRTRKVLLQWRVKNKSASWEPLTKALCKIGLTEVAVDVEHHFVTQEKPEIPVEVDGIYCSICDKCHGINSYTSQAIIPRKSVSFDCTIRYLYLFVHPSLTCYLFYHLSIHLFVC